MGRSRKRRRGAGTGVRFSSSLFGLWPLRITCVTCFVIAVGLAVVAVVSADIRLAPFAAGVFALGLVVLFWAWVDVWQVDTRERILTRTRHRLLDDYVEEKLPFSAIQAVLLTSPNQAFAESRAEIRYRVELVLHSGSTVFFTTRRRHAASLASLLGVPQRSGLPPY
jgi:hypothetical protein